MNKKLDLVSVIVPVYNVQDYLVACLDSLVNQTYSNCEFICVNDSSTDDSLFILTNYRTNDSRFKIISHSKNEGLGPSRNTGLRAASGEYIFFLDSDDYIKENCIECLVSCAQADGTDITMCKTIAFSDDRNDREINSRVDAFNTFNYYHPIHNQLLSFNEIMNSSIPCTAWGKLFKRQFINDCQLRFISAQIKHEDNGFWVKCLSNRPRFSYTDKTGICYRFRKNSIMGKQGFTVDASHLMHVYKDALLYIKQKNLSPYNLSTLLTYICFLFYKQNVSLNLVREVFEDDSDVWRLVDNIKNTQFEEPFTIRAYLKYKILSHLTFGEIKNQYKQKYTALKKIKNNNEITFNINQYLKYKLLYRFTFGESRKKLYRWQKEIYSNLRKKRSLINGLIHLKSPFLYQPELTKHNFKTIAFDDGVLLNVLRQCGSFSFIPNPGNLGDALIAQATYQFFKKNKLPYTLWDGNPAQTIVYGGGGIWFKDVYKKGYSKSLKAFESAQKIVILPSSIYQCRDLEVMLDKRFTIFCRERQTYDYLKGLNTKAKILLDYDMAFRLCEDCLTKAFQMTDKRANLIADCMKFSQSKHGVARLFRMDAEKKGYLESDFDLSGLFCSDMRVKDDVTFGTILMLCVVDKYNTVVTDRLHIGVASALLGKETYLMDNNYGKISSVYSHSLQALPHVHLVTSVSKTLLQAPITQTDNLERIYHAIQEHL